MIHINVGSLFVLFVCLCSLTSHWQCRWDLLKFQFFTSKKVGRRPTSDDCIQDDRIYEMSQKDRNPAPTHLLKHGVRGTDKRKHRRAEYFSRIYYYIFSMNVLQTHKMAQLYPDHVTYCDQWDFSIEGCKRCQTAISRVTRNWKLAVH